MSSKNTLTIDAGNTTISWGIWSGNKLIKQGKHPTSEYTSFRAPDRNLRVIYSSVVPQIDRHFARLFPNFKNIKYTDLKNLKIALPNKKEIGIDRLVNAYGAVEFYGVPLIIVDFGTATTFCIIDQNRVYQGGLICPGINLTRIVLHEKTAKLPLIELKARPKNLIGKSSVLAMQSGIFFGYQSLVEGILRRLKKELGGNYRVIATGGYARLICDKLQEKIDFIDPDLTLKSLYFIGRSFF